MGQRIIEIDLELLSTVYTLTSDGRLYNKVRERWCSPNKTIPYGYVQYWVSTGRIIEGVSVPGFVKAHILVAYKYIGPPPSPIYVIDHKNTIKSDNHYTNLQWLTHSANLLKAYREDGVRPGATGHSRIPGSETRIKMSNAKKKKVLNMTTNEVYMSIEECAEKLSTYRRAIYRSIKNNKPLSGHYLSYIKEVCPKS